MAEKSILKRLGTDPVIGIYGTLQIDHNEDKSIGDRNGTLEFKDLSSNIMTIKPPANFNPNYTPLVHEMPNKPINVMIEDIYKYVDNYVKGLDVKQSADLATTENINLATTDVTSSSIDGIQLKLGDRILVKEQTNAIENGVYILEESVAFPNGKLVRAPDFIDASGNDGEGFVTVGAYVFVEHGIENVNKGFVVVKDDNAPNKDRMIVGTDEINIIQFSGKGILKEGHGISIDRIDDESDRISVNTDISFNDVSLNKIGALSDPSKNIIVNANLIPGGPYSLYGNAGSEIISNYSLGSRDKRWKELFVSGKTVFINDSALSLNTTDTEENGVKKRLIEFVFFPKSNDDPSGNHTSISIARGEFTVETDASGNETLIPNTEKFGTGLLTELVDVDVSQNMLTDGNRLIYDKSSKKYVVGESEYVNNSNQSFFDIQSEQPKKFKKADTDSEIIDTGSVIINWSYDDIIARNAIPNGDRRLFGMRTNSNKKTNTLPYIDKIRIDISGSTSPDYPTPNLASGWLEYNTKIIENEHDYYTDAYSNQRNEQIKYNQFKIYKTGKGNENNSIIDNILSQTDEDPVANPNYKYDLRVYGINDSSDNPTNVLDRILLFKDLYFLGAFAPSQPQATVPNNESISSTPTISRSFFVVNTENTKPTSDALLISADASYNINETLASQHDNYNDNDGVINTEQSYDYNASPKSNNDAFSLTLNNAYGTNSGLKFATRYNYSIIAKNNLTTRESDRSTQLTSGFTPMPSASPSNTSFTISESTTKTRIFNESLNNSNKIYINTTSISSGSLNRILFNVTQNTTQFQVTHPSPALSSSGSGFGKFVDSEVGLNTFKIFVGNATSQTLRQTISFNGFNNLGNTNGITDTKDATNNPSSNSYINVASSSTFCKDMFATDNRKKGLRLTGKLTLNDIANTDINNFIGTANENKYVLKYEYFRKGIVNSNGSDSTYTKTFDIYIDDISGEPVINSANSSNIITVTDVIYTMGIPSVKYFKLDISRNYQNMNSQYKYLRGDGTIASLNDLTSTYASGNGSNNLIKRGQNEINNNGQYTYSVTDINTDTSNYYQKISYNTTINGLTNLTFNEKLFSLNTSTNGISKNNTINVNHYFDMGSYTISRNSNSNAYANFVKKFNISISEIVENDLSIFNSNLGTIGTTAYNVHSDLIKSWTLLYFNGKFRTNTNTLYPNVGSFQFNNALPSSHEDYTTTMRSVAYGLTGQQDNSTGYKWIVFNKTINSTSDLVQDGTKYFFNIYGYLNSYFQGNVMSLLRGSVPGGYLKNDVIGFIRSSFDGSIRVGNLQESYSGTDIWYGKSSSISLTDFIDLDISASYGTKIQQSTTSWGPIVKTSSFPINIEIFVGLRNTKDL